MEEKALKNKLLANSQSVDETSDLKFTDIVLQTNVGRARPTDIPFAEGGFFCGLCPLYMIV